MDTFEELYVVGKCLISFKEKFDSQDIRLELQNLINRYDISFNNLITDLDFLCYYEDVNHNKYETRFKTCANLSEVAHLLEIIMDEYYTVQSVLESFHNNYFEGYIAEISLYNPNEYYDEADYIDNFKNNGSLDYLRDLYNNFIVLANAKHHFWYINAKAYALTPFLDDAFLVKTNNIYKDSLPNYFICDEEDEVCYSNLDKIFRLFIDEIQYINNFIDNFSLNFQNITFPTYKGVISRDLSRAIKNYVEYKGKGEYRD